MVLKRISEPEYQIEHPAFKDVVFTASSPLPLNTLSHAIAFAQEKGGILESARESAAFRIEAKRQDEANTLRVTRTAVAYFKDDDTWYAAIDDIADPKESIILTRGDRGYIAHRDENSWLVPRDDAYLCGILKRAERTDRIAPVPQVSPLRLATQAASGTSPFGENALMRAIFGEDVVEAYARFLHNCNRDIACSQFLTPEELERLDIGRTKTEIRLVVLGNNPICDVYAMPCDYFYIEAPRSLNDIRARGVRFLATEQPH